MTAADILNAECLHGPRKIRRRDCQTCQVEMLAEARAEGFREATEQGAAYLRDQSSKAEYLGVSIALHEASMHIRALLPAAAPKEGDSE